MATQDRIRKYRETGGGADLVRVEVLVPAARRADILARAAQVREEHRQRKDRLQALMDEALSAYRLRVLDNVDLDRVADIEDRSRIIARQLMERGDARAFVMARRLLAALEG